MELLDGIIYMLWRGIAIGIIISAPMGPVGILCVQRTLEKGRKNGFFTGIGAAISDIFYCLLTGFGLSFIEDFLKANQDVIQIIGSVVLILFGLYLFKSNPARNLKTPEEQKISKRKTILSGFLFTFSNPLIIFLIIGLFARFNFLLPEITLGHYLVGFASIFLGALLWWWMVTYFVDKVRTHFNLRSMWLINKITGSIIMIFGVVGTITAITSIASAQEIEPIMIENNRSDTITKILPLDMQRDFSLSFRLTALNNQSGKSYLYFDETGTRRKVKNPMWGISLFSGAKKSSVMFKTVDDSSESLYPPRIDVMLLENDNEISKRGISEGLDLFAGKNAFRLRRVGDEIIVEGGNRKYNELLRFPAETMLDSIGLIVMPGAAVNVESISLKGTPVDSSQFSNSHFANPDVRNSYFARSLDPIEGEYEIYDRMLEDKYLRMGGDYRLAIVKTEDGYDLIYLSGAQKLADSWKPGMRKGGLNNTSYAGVYDVEWINPDGKRLPGEIKAQIADGGIIALQFVQHSSNLRLRKVKR